MYIIMKIDKKQAILQAALEEFYQKGYEGASTNRITKEAGVSKGILFHYFSDKRSLYLTLVDECMNHYYRTLNSNLTDLSDDLFEALEQLSKIKINLFKSDPMMYGFISHAFMAMPEELKSELELKQRRMQTDSVPLLASRIDRSRFRSGIKPEEAIEFVLLSLEALITKRLSKLHEEKLNGNEIAVVMDTSPYLDMLRYGIYRKEEN